MADSLVLPLFDGPLDVVADVHGEIDALRALLRHLGYEKEGLSHPHGRRLVFLGDLTDRGPDSPAVVQLVSELVFTRRGQCVMGNHDLNLLLGEQKHGNHWFFGEPEALDTSGRIVPQVLAGERERAEALGLFARLPLVLERADLRIVHACWNPEAVAMARQSRTVVRLYERHALRIENELEHSALDEVERNLAKQNRNPVKVLTSGLEKRAATSFHAGGKDRWEERDDWWKLYHDEAACVFGHFGRQSLSWEPKPDLINEADPFAGLGNGQAFCIDYSVAKRWQERFKPGFDGRYHTALAALRFPEMELVFDDGSNRSVAATR